MNPEQPAYRFSLPWLLAGLLCLTGGQALAQTDEPPASGQLVVDHLRIENRSAQGILETIRPMVSGAGDLGRIGDILVITTDPANMRRLRQRIEELDIPRRSLNLQVDFARNTEPELEQASSTREQRMMEEETLRLRYPAANDGTAEDQEDSEIPALELVLRPRLEEDTVRLDYGYGPAGQNVEADSTLRFPAGEWQTLTEEGTAADSPLAYLRQQIGGDTETPGAPPGQPPVAIRIDVLP